MSTREIAFNILDRMTERQLESFVQLFSEIAVDEIPNEDTLQAMKETEDILSGKVKAKGYNSAKELFEDLNL